VTQAEIEDYFRKLVGKRIELVSMPSDPAPIPVGSRGRVDGVTGPHPIRGESFRQIDVRWDSGRTLSLCVPPDGYRIVNETPREKFLAKVSALADEAAIEKALPGLIGELVEWDVASALELAANLAEDVNAHDEAAAIRGMAQDAFLARDAEETEPPKGT